MSNESAFFLLMFADLLFVLVCYFLGRHFLYVAVVANIMFTNMVSAKLVSVFGFEQTVANATYAAIFLATDLLSEHHGRDEARKAVWMGFLALVPLILFAPIVIQFSSSSLSADVSAALDVIFDLTPRIAIASLCAYLIAQHVDVNVYHLLKARFPGVRYLWLRNNGSTVVSQFLDQMIFVVLAFSFVVPASTLFQIFLAGFVIKVLVALFDTPFLYASHWINQQKASNRH